MTIKYYTTGKFDPLTATDGSAGLDLFINTIEGDRLLTGVHVEIPKYHVGLLLPRSSWGIKGFQLANTCGVIDSDYRGEIIMVRDPHPIKAQLRLNVGDRVGQLVVVPCITSITKCKSLEDLSSTARDTDGFGSSGDN